MKVGLGLSLIGMLAAAVLSGCLATEDGTVASDSSSSAPAPTSSVASNETSAAPVADPPVAAFTGRPTDANQTNITAGADLTFNGSASFDPAGGNLTFTWDFGDNGTAEGAVTNHSYAAAGNYTVTLTVKSDASGLENSTSSLVAVAEAASGALPAPLEFKGTAAVDDRGTSVKLEFVLAASPATATFHMEFNSEAMGAPEIDNDLDWTIAGPDGQGGEGINYGPEDDIIVDGPLPGAWTIDLDVYSVFPTGMEWKVTVTFA